MEELVLGIDEAGRGAAIGPLTMAAVVVRPDQVTYLTSQKVSDSKKHKDIAKRALLAQRIRCLCTWLEAMANNVEIDKYVEKNQLNVLERKLAYDLVLGIADMQVPVTKIVLDGHNLFDPLKEELSNLTIMGCKPEVIVTNKAESKYIACAAASILAKDKRDRITKQFMGPTYFNNGAGYCNAGTARWIREQPVVAHKVTRWSYRWAKKLKEELK